MYEVKYPRRLGLMLVGVAFFQTGCAPSQIRCHQEAVSRDYTCIEFTENTRPLTIEGEVGGEHMSFYKVLGFEGDRFQVSVTSLEGRAASHISGDSVRIEAVRGAGAFQKRIEVEGQEGFFTIGLSAHPYARYRLHIEKLKRDQKVDASASEN